MKVIILAAGYAVRLQELTANNPKPLLEIGGKRIIDRILKDIAKLKEVDSICVVTNGKFFENFDAWAKSSLYKKKISVVNDGTTSNETRLGAIKDLALAIEKKAMDDDVLVVAGDNLFDFKIADFIKFAKTHSDGVSVALHDINDLDRAKSFGVVGIDGKQKVVNFWEKPEKPASTLISTGIYYFPKKKLSFIKEYIKMQNKVDAPGYYISWLANKDKVYGFVFLEDWYDIGNIESFKEADRKYYDKERGKDDKA